MNNFHIVCNGSVSQTVSDPDCYVGVFTISLVNIVQALLSLGSNGHVFLCMALPK